jgi:uncharacterized protein (DUF4415 family)
MRDEEIDCSDIPDISALDWTHADIVLPEAKTRMTIRIDTNIYRFFKSQGPRYQSRINAVLRAYVGSQRLSDRKPRKQKRAV